MLAINVIKMIGDTLEQNSAKNRYHDPYSNEQASSLLLSRRVACSNYAFLKLSIFLFQGNLWT